MPKFGLGKVGTLNNAIGKYEHAGSRIKHDPMVNQELKTA
jgi:hypothetical protein